MISNSHLSFTHAHVLSAVWEKDGHRKIWKMAMLIHYIHLQAGIKRSELHSGGGDRDPFCWDFSSTRLPLLKIVTSHAHLPTININFHSYSCRPMITQHPDASTDEKLPSGEGLGVDTSRVTPGCSQWPQLAKSCQQQSFRAPPHKNKARGVLMSAAR